MDNKNGLTLVIQPQDYFRELIVNAMGNQRVNTQPEIEYYLVNLLHQFISTDRLYPRGADGNIREEPLALMLKDAFEQPNTQEQQLLFRQVGDVSLYTAGFFQDSLNRKLVDVDYYIDLGGQAYQKVAALADEQTLVNLYEELADRFGCFVEILAEVSDQTNQKTEKDLLRLYELWLKTGSERAAKALQEAGIVPNPSIKKSLTSVS